VRCFFINERLPHSMETALSAYGRCVRLPAFPALAEPVCRHPDMMLARIGGRLLIHRAYVAGRAVLDALGVPYALSDAEVGADYPHDAALDVFTAGGCLFAAPKVVSPAVLDAAVHEGFRFVPVKQGYAGCSTIAVGDAVVSADAGICHAARENGLAVLQIEPGGIGIERYDTGFIGGACGVIDNKTVGFFGDVRTFGAYARLCEFFEPRGISLVSLGEGALFDYGGVVADGGDDFEGDGKRTRTGGAVCYRLLCDKHRGNCRRDRQSGLSAGTRRACKARHPL